MLKKMMVVVVAMIVSFAGMGQAFEADIAGDISVDYNGKYIWRGQLLSDDPVLQPGIGFGIGNLYLNIWGNMGTTEYSGNSGEFNEVDYTIDYSDAITDVLGYSIGAIRYDFPNTGFDATTEIYAGLSLDTVLSPSVTVYYDIDEADGVYVSFGVGHSIDLSDTMALDISAALGWGDEDYNTFYWGVADDAANDLSVSVALPIAMGDWTLTPSVNYVSLMDSDLRASNAYATNSDNDKSDYFYAGIGLSTEF
ncbi:MAG: hypothetical protein ACIAQZ_17095 [Sedimentisphaeraceae bacterium JB056]